MENNFLLPPEQYERSINPLGDWLKQTALYASKMTGKSFEACVKHLKKKLNNKEIPISNPTVLYYERGENGDREKKTIPLSAYIREVLQNNEVLAPTFTSLKYLYCL